MASELEREVKELRTANEILKKGEPMERHWSERHRRTHILPRRSSTAFVGKAVPRTPFRSSSSQMIAFIEEHREVYGGWPLSLGPMARRWQLRATMANPICRVLPIAPATFHRHAAIARNPGLASERARHDRRDFEEIRRVHDKSRGRYGARKVFAVAHRA